MDTTSAKSLRKKLATSWFFIAQPNKKLKTNFSTKRLSSKCSSGHKDCSFDEPAENVSQRIETFSHSFPKKEKVFFLGNNFLRRYSGNIENNFVKAAFFLVNCQKFSVEKCKFFRKMSKNYDSWNITKLFLRNKLHRSLKKQFWRN